MSEITAAKEYDQWFQDNEPLFESEARAIEAQLPDNWAHAVEIGCGTGLFSDRLGIEHGVEPSEPMATRARDRGLSVEAGTAEDIPLADDAADLALLLGVIGYVDDPATVFRELARIVSPGGTVVVAFLHADRGFAQLYDKAIARGHYPADLSWERPYPLAMASQATWRTTEMVTEHLESAGFAGITSVQTLTQPVEEAVNTVESPSPGHDTGSWIVLRARRR